MGTSGVPWCFDSESGYSIVFVSWWITNSCPPRCGDYKGREVKFMGEELKINGEAISLEDSLGIVKCGWCGGVTKEDNLGAAMKYLGLQDCDCERDGEGEG